VAAALDAAPGLLVTDIDEGVVAKARQEIPVLANRRL
jgi:predicted amidohydrolase